MTADVPNTPGTLGWLWHAAHIVADQAVRKAISEVDQTGVLTSEFVHAFTTKSSTVLHVFVGPTRSTSILVLEIQPSCVRVLTDSGYERTAGAQCVGTLDKQLAHVVLQHGPAWIRRAAAEIARRVDEAQAVCAFSTALAEYNRALELQL